MIEVKPTRQKICLFLDNLRNEDKEELLINNSSDIVDEILDIFSNPIHQTYFLYYKNLPIALGGAYFVQDEPHKIARIWLLTSKYAKYCSFELYKYITNKISIFQLEYDILFNFIYKSNFKSLNWIKKANFNVLDLISDDYKLFYFLKGDINFDIRYFTC